MLRLYAQPENQEVHHELLTSKQVRLFVKREDKIHPYVSGNKWRKLKYNLEEAKKEGEKVLLTFGGAYSNHIYATSAAAKEAGFRSIGIIRGDELQFKPLNETLQFADLNGMHLSFIDRQSYRIKHDSLFIKELHERFGSFYLIPEGGTNMHAIKGCEEIITDEDRGFDVVCCAVGTGGTLAGLIAGMRGKGKVFGFSALKGDFLTSKVNNLLNDYGMADLKNWEIMEGYHFGGYAKSEPALLEFIADFTANCGILLDSIYTGKMIYGLFDLIKKDNFSSGSKILVIHTGGLRESI